MATMMVITGAATNKKSVMNKDYVLCLCRTNKSAFSALQRWGRFEEVYNYCKALIWWAWRPQVQCSFS